MWQSSEFNLKIQITPHPQQLKKSISHLMLSVKIIGLLEPWKIQDQAQMLKKKAPQWFLDFLRFSPREEKK